MKILFAKFHDVSWDSEAPFEHLGLGLLDSLCHGLLVRAWYDGFFEDHKKNKSDKNFCWLLPNQGAYSQVFIMLGDKDFPLSKVKTSIVKDDKRSPGVFFLGDFSTKEIEKIKKEFSQLEPYHEISSKL
jgi:hypothetical protein